MRTSPDAYVFAHVSGLLPDERQRRLMVILQACIDDSATNRRRGPGLYMLGGLVAPAESWAAFSIEWQAKLDEAPGLSYFKLSQAMSMKDEFHPDKGWTEELRTQRVIDLAKIAKQHSVIGVSCFMPQEPYDRFVKSFTRHKALKDPYLLCFYQIVDALTEARGKLPPTDDIQYVFDEHGEIGVRAAGFWKTMRTSIPWTRPDLLGSTPKHEDDKKFRPLQAADLYAGLRRMLQEKRQLSDEMLSWAEPFDGLPLEERHYGEEDMMWNGAQLVIQSALKRGG